ncbi:MAG TPA: type 1 glutamine amidotransferase [Spirillospora sp.]
MRALVIEHDAITPAGTIGDRLAHHGFGLTRLLVVPADRHTAPDVRVDFPDPSGFDLVVSMGAPWSVYDEAKIGTWIGDELTLLREAHHGGVPVLGVCFGGQALAAALGGRVERAPRPEIGWTGVETREPALVGPGPWFQYHFDRWVTPPDATEIAHNDVGPQAFRIGRSMAVQFHPEVTVDIVKTWQRFGEKDIRGLGLDPEALVAQTRERASDAERRAHRFVDAFLHHAGLRRPDLRIP